MTLALSSRRIAPVSTLAQAVPRIDRANLLAIVLGVGMAFYLATSRSSQGWVGSMAR